MPKSNPPDFHFHSFDRRNIELSFEGGLPLVRQIDARLGVVKDLSKVLPDDRHPDLITHSQEEILRQRIFGLVQGYEDLNNHDTLRHDLLWQTAVNRDTPLASSPNRAALPN